jgi:hypothetical protein
MLVMEISFEAVKNVFLNVLEGRMTREEADRWAYSIVKASESEDLICTHPEDKKRIWEGVMYLYGIDLMEKPSEYLHTEEDIRKTLQNILNVNK